MSWLLVVLVSWAAVAVLAAAWLGGAARVVAHEGGRSPEFSPSEELAALPR
jgi:hypothetical protein